MCKLFKKVNVNFLLALSVHVQCKCLGFMTNAIHLVGSDDGLWSADRKWTLARADAEVARLSAVDLGQQVVEGRVLLVDVVAGSLFRTAVCSSAAESRTIHMSVSRILVYNAFQMFLNKMKIFSKNY